MNPANLSPFARAYVIAALWSSTDDNGDPLNSKRDIADIDPATLATMAQEADTFARENRADIDAAELDDGHAGHYFWLSRNGHGSGFFDEYSKGDPRQAACDRLQEKSRCAGCRDLYKGDNGNIYMS